jgi:hypothetical protein
VSGSDDGRVFIWSTGGAEEDHDEIGKSQKELEQQGQEMISQQQQEQQQLRAEDIEVIVVQRQALCTGSETTIATTVFGWSTSAAAVAAGNGGNRGGPEPSEPVTIASAPISSNAACSGTPHDCSRSTDTSASSGGGGGGGADRSSGGGGGADRSSGGGADHSSGGGGGADHSSGGGGGADHSCAGSDDAAIASQQRRGMTLSLSHATETMTSSESTNAATSTLPGDSQVTSDPCSDRIGGTSGNLLEAPAAITSPPQGRLLMMQPGDSQVVNCMAWSPFGPCRLITGGIDYDIKVWEPFREGPDALAEAQQVAEANAEALTRPLRSGPIGPLMRMLRRLIQERRRGEGDL